MLPRSNRVGVEPAPDRAVADAGDQSELPRLLRHVGHAKARQRRAQRCRQLTRQRLDLHDHGWGKKPGAGLGAPDPPIRPGAPGRSVCATGSPFRAACAASPRSRRCPSLRRPAGSSWPERPGNTVTYISPPDGLAREPRRATKKPKSSAALPLQGRGRDRRESPTARCSRPVRAHRNCCRRRARAAGIRATRPPWGSACWRSTDRTSR